MLFFYHNDINGAPLRLTDQQGKVVWNVHYDVMGRIDIPRLRVNEVHNPIRMQGQYEDSETGLYYNRYRYFDPNICGYVSQDPIRLSAGINLYSYGLNSLGWIDPLGLSCKKTESAKKEEALDWNIIRKKTGETREQHVKLHETNNLQKQDHGVFYGDSKTKINEAWKNKGDLVPTTENGVDIYKIQSPNSGYSGGYAGQGQNLNNITIITKSGTNQIITGYPN